MTKNIILSNGVTMPSIGYGTYRIKGTKLVSDCISTALSLGYRLIDTATVYGNEEDIGAVLPDTDDIFVTTKLGPKDQGYESTSAAIRSSLAKLRRRKLDLYLIHCPGTQGLKESDPENEKRRLESWKAMTEFYREGIIRAIGVSNFEIRHLEGIMQHSDIVPHVNQVEIHPHYTQKELSDFCKEHDIHIQAYSSLGTTIATNPYLPGKDLLHDETVIEVARRCDKSPAQILLKWGLQNGYSVIPKSITKERMAENLDADNFELSVDDLNTLNNLPITHKYAWNTSNVY